MATEEKKTNVSESHEVEAVASSRNTIVLVILAIVLTLGSSIFFLTTSITRADLPVDQVQRFSEELKQQVEFTVPVYMNVPKPLETVFLNVQSSLDQELAKRYPELEQFWSIELRYGEADPKDYVVNYEFLSEGDESVSISAREINVKFTSKVMAQPQLNAFIVKVLLEDVFGQELEDFKQIILGNHKESNLVLPYSSKYNVVLSLFTENGRSIDWEINDAKNLLTPIFNQLTHFSNFSVSSQIQYYSNLADELFHRENDEMIIKQADLSTFINFGDWNLFTHDINPTINFMVYFPEANYFNLDSRIENSTTNSFLVPQWGGVYILNKKMNEGASSLLTKEELTPIIDIFAGQLLQLIGMPQHPKSSLVRIDHFSRTTIYKNLRQALDNLLSLIKLTNALNEISIPEQTKVHVESSLQYINSSVYTLQSQDFSTSMELSARALADSNLAFFEKEMVQQAYFPSEHKMAVFLPLLGPVCTVCFLGLIKFLKDKKQKRKQKQE